MSAIGTRARFKDAPWFERIKGTQVIVGGAGGIGSWLSLLLTRAGVSVYLHDMDTVEEHNIGGQLFGPQDIGNPKTEAVMRKINLLCNTNINPIRIRGQFTQDSAIGKFCFSGFDNMNARKIMFEKWAASYVNDPEAIYIDGRLQAEQLQVFCVTPDKIEEYRKHLFDDDKISDGPCSFKQTSHTAAMIAAHMTTFFTNHIANLSEKNKARKVPFFYEYFSPIAMVNKIN